MQEINGKSIVQYARRQAGDGRFASILALKFPKKHVSSNSSCAKSLFSVNLSLQFGLLPEEQYCVRKVPEQGAPTNMGSWREPLRLTLNASTRKKLHSLLRRIFYLVCDGFTSMPRLQSSYPAHAKFVVCDCTIENRLHWRRDVTLRVDHCQVRKGDAPRVVAVLNSFLLAVLDFLGVSNVPQQMRIFDAYPLQAVCLLLGSLLTFK